MTSTDHRTDAAPGASGSWPTADLSSAPPEAAPDAPEVAPAGYGGGGGYAEWASSFGDDGRAMSPLRRWGGLALLIGGIVALAVFSGLGLVIAILAIVVSIFLHELGHFLTAKWAGMKVTEFFIGFGPRIWSFQRGETEYGVKVLPAGAYVRIIGMHNLEEVDPADEDRTYRVKPYHKRLAVILAGPFMNIALAFGLLTGLYLVSGVPDQDRWSIGSVSPGGAADRAQLEKGDRLLAVDGQQVGAFENLGKILVDKDGVVTLTVERDGAVQDVPIDLGWRLNAAGAAAIAGLADKDRITRVGEAPVATFEEAGRRLAEASGPTPIEIERRGYLYRATVEGPVQVPEGGAGGYLGVGAGPAEKTSVSPPGAAVESVRTMGTAVAMSGKAFGALLSPSGLSNYAGTVVDAAGGSNQPAASSSLVPIRPAPGSPEDLQPWVTPASAERPVSIVGIVFLLDDASSVSWAQVIFLLAIVNLSLGLLNLLPLLPFDGGHAAVATYEAIRSRKGRPYRVDIAKLLPLTYAVVGVLLVFGLTSIFLDIRSPITGP